MAMSENRLGRIFVVEQSATGLGGHHLEYAVRIATNSGYAQKHVVGNKKLKLIGDAGEIVIHSVYRYGYWDLPGKNFIKFLQRTVWTKKRNLNSSFKLPKFLVRTYFEISTLKQPEVFVSMFQTKSDWPPKIPKVKISVFALLALSFVPFFFILFITKYFFGGSITKLKNLMARKTISLIRKILSYLLKFTYLYSFRKKYKRFLSETSSFIKRNHLNTSDLLFFGTLSLIELSALIKALEQLPNKPSTLVILRREPNESGEKPWNWQKIANLSKSCDIIFYADTKELAATYSNLFGFSVGVFPIPAGDFQTSPIESEKYFEVSYLGDARSEKGFESFVNLATDNPHTRFFAQINHSENFDSKLALALHSIERSNAITVSKPMDSKSYLEKLDQSELIWIGYLGENYEQRSSGIYVEATIRGIPSLVTNGSWMHAEIYRNSFDYWEESIGSNKTDWNNSRRGVVKFLTSPNKKISFEFLLSTGIKLLSTGWSNSDGVLYLVLPLLHESESICSIEQHNSNLKMEYVGFAALDSSPLWIGGLVLSTSERAQLCLTEFRGQKSSYVNFKSKIEKFSNFHSNANIRNISEGLTQ